MEASNGSMNNATLRGLGVPPNQSMQQTGGDQKPNVQAVGGGAAAAGGGGAAAAAAAATTTLPSMQLPNSIGMSLAAHPLLNLHPSLVAQNMLQQQLQQNSAQLMLQNLMQFTAQGGSAPPAPMMQNQGIMQQTVPMAAPQAAPVSLPVPQVSQQQPGISNNINTAQVDMLQNFLKLSGNPTPPPQNSQNSTGNPQNTLTAQPPATVALPLPAAPLSSQQGNTNTAQNLINPNAANPHHQISQSLIQGMNAGAQQHLTNTMQSQQQLPAQGVHQLGGQQQNMQHQGNSNAQLAMLQNLMMLAAPSAFAGMPGMNNPMGFPSAAPAGLASSQHHQQHQPQPGPQQLQQQLNANPMMLQNLLQMAGNPAVSMGMGMPQAAPSQPAHPAAIAVGPPNNSGILSASSTNTNRRGLPMPIFIDYDEETLTEYQCLLRQQIELFEAGPDDVKASAQGRNNPILLGQVGIRCRHCVALPLKCRPRGAVYYSKSIDGIYQVAQNMAKLHFCRTCNQIPGDVRAKLSQLQKVNRRAAGGKEYWSEGLRVLGVYEDQGVMRFRHTNL